MPPRRSHRKSHNGCLQCKRRHVKCDEQRPTCSPCTKRELSCHFQPNTGFESGQSPSDGPNESLLRERSHHGPLPARILELKLLHHFVTATSTMFCPREEDLECWQVHVPNMALEYTFLLDGLLAISALHLAHLETGAKKSWLQTALRYQDLTLAGLNKALCRINPENCAAVAVCSVFVLLLSIAIPGVCEDPDEEASRNPIAELLGLRKLLEGMELVVNQSEMVLRDGMWKDFFSPVIDPGSLSPRPVMPGAEEAAFAHGQKVCPHILSSLTRLKSYINSRTSKHHTELLTACDSLVQTISPLSTLSHSPVITWPHKISPYIFYLLDRSDPLACLLFLHYGVVLDIFSYWWFTRNAGRRLVRALSVYEREIDGEWREWVEWAKRTVGVVVRE